MNRFSKFVGISLTIPLVVLLVCFTHKESIEVRWHVSHMPHFPSKFEEQQVFSFSTYDNYNLLLGNKEQRMHSDFQYALENLTKKLKVSPDYYALYAQDEYCVVWQLENGYYRLSSVYDSGHKAMTLKVSSGRFTDSFLLGKSEKISNMRHHFKEEDQ